jgi:2-keto-4-pentenoate hydratase/2-oxohepta-3-ene-1,7-dioic acid hydratase in catechol pathway
VQKGEVKDMIFALPELLSYLQNHFPLMPGDWILTGTPAGVGPLNPGDQLKAQIPGKLTAQWRVVGPA